MASARTGDVVHWIADDEQTESSGRIVFIGGDYYVVRVDNKFRASNKESMNPHHEVILDLSDIMEFNGAYDD